MQTEFLPQVQRIFLCVRFWPYVFLFLLLFSSVLAAQDTKTSVNFTLDLRQIFHESRDQYLEIRVTDDLHPLDEQKILKITKKYFYLGNNSGQLTDAEWVSIPEFNKRGFVNDEDQSNLRIEDMIWAGALEAAKISLTQTPLKLQIKDLPIKPSNYKVKVTDGEGKTLLEKKLEIREGSSQEMFVSGRDIWKELLEKYATNESLLLTIIIGLIGALGAVLQDKIKTAFNWILDRLGKYGNGKLAERRFARIYADIISTQHKYLKLIGFYTTGISRPLLEEVFVSLRISTFDRNQNTSEKNAGNAEGSVDPPTAVSFATAMSQYDKMVILGGPGTGKTTTLSYSLLVFLKKKAGEKLYIHDDLLPIFIPLRRLSNNNNSILDDLIDRETQILPADLLDECPKGYFEKNLKNGQCIILLDGLDEVVDEKTHYLVAEKINAFAARYPKNRYIVTCRIAGWQSLLSGDFNVLQTQDFSREEIQRFVSGWHRAVITQSEYARLQLDNPDKVRDADKFEKLWNDYNQKTVRPAIEISSKNLLEAIDSKNRILAVASNPMLLSLICLVHFARNLLPRGRTILYSQCIELLIDAWDRSRGIAGHQSASITPIQKEAILREIAFEFQRQGIGETSRAELENLIGDKVKRLGIGMPAKEMLEEIELRSGLLTERSIGVFGFSHLTLQEYLVAKHIQLTPSYVNLLYKNLDKQEWREVLLLYAGLLDDATDLIAQIGAVDSLERTILAGYCIGDAQHCDEKVSGVIIDKLLEALDTCGGGNCEELVNVISRIASDFNEKAVKIEQKLSQNLITALDTLNASDIPVEEPVKNVDLNRIAILGKARITHSLPILILLLGNRKPAIREQAISAIVSFGNLAISRLKNKIEWPKEITPEQVQTDEVHDSLKITIIELLPPGQSSEGPSNLISIMLTQQGIMEVLSEINTGESAKTLLTFYDIEYPHPFAQKASFMISQMLKNPFVEEELKQLTSISPSSSTYFDFTGDGWFYPDIPESSTFFVLEKKLINDVAFSILKHNLSGLSIHAVYSKTLGRLSFKILFPAIIKMIKADRVPDVVFIDNKNSEIISVFESQEEVPFLESLGFSGTEEFPLDILKDQIRKNTAMTVQYALKTGGGVTVESGSEQKYKKRWAYLLGNGLFVFLTLSIYFSILLWINYYNSYGNPFKNTSLPEPISTIWAIWLMLSPVFFILTLGIISHLKLRRRFNLSQISNSLFFPLQNFHDILPHFTRQRLAVKQIVLHSLAFFCSPAGWLSIALTYAYFFTKIADSIGALILVFSILLLPNMMLLFASLIYLKLHVLRQNPIYQLILLHPEGKKLLNKH